MARLLFEIGIVAAICFFALSWRAALWVAAFGFAFSWVALLATGRWNFKRR